MEPCFATGTRAPVAPDKGACCTDTGAGNSSIGSGVGEVAGAVGVDGLDGDAEMAAAVVGMQAVEQL